MKEKVFQRELSPDEIERAGSHGERHVSALKEYQELLMEYNRRINLVSRRHDPEFFEHHIMHALALSVRDFVAGSRVVDWGSGGGIPVIPLALTFPDVEFVCIDKVEKKIRALRAMAGELGLKNIRAVATRAESVSGQFEHSISRATASLSSLWKWHTRIWAREMDGSAGIADNAESETNTCWKSGLLCLKGGDLRSEIGALTKMEPAAYVEVIDIGRLYRGDYFQEKRIVHVSIRE